LTDEFLGIAELCDLSGRIIARLEKPPHRIYAERTFVPTWVAEDSENGKPVRLWLADGYGSYLIHAYDGGGRYEFSISGEEGAGRFDCPQGIGIGPFWFPSRSCVRERSGLQAVYDPLLGGDVCQSSRAF
jgi:hypothetical protein